MKSNLTFWCFLHYWWVSCAFCVFLCIFVIFEGVQLHPLLHPGSAKGAEGCRGAQLHASGICTPSGTPGRCSCTPLHPPAPPPAHACILHTRGAGGVQLHPPGATPRDFWGSVFFGGCFVQSPRRRVRLWPVGLSSPGIPTQRQRSPPWVLVIML